LCLSAIQFDLAFVLQEFSRFWNGSESSVEFLKITFRLSSCSDGSIRIRDFSDLNFFFLISPKIRTHPVIVSQEATLILSDATTKIDSIFCQLKNFSILKSFFLLFQLSPSAPDIILELQTRL
jgi:hypothetical protein